MPQINSHIKKIFEKYIENLKLTYQNYLKKIETAVQMQQNLKNNLDSVFENQIKTTTKLQKALDSFIQSHEKFVLKKFKDQKELEGLTKVIQEVSEN